MRILAFQKARRKNGAISEGVKRGRGERVRVNGNVKIAWNALGWTVNEPLNPNLHLTKSVLCPDTQPQRACSQHAGMPCHNYLSIGFKNKYFHLRKLRKYHTTEDLYTLNILASCFLWFFWGGGEEGILATMLPETYRGLIMEVLTNWD